MAALARWTNLSETTFLLAPTDPAADYRLRIFTPGGELPFAGHPTLGTCHAWLEAGGMPADDDRVVQQCQAGLVTVRRGVDGLAFAAPPLVRSGPIDDDTRREIVDFLGIGADDVVDAAWVDNGPGWAAVLLRDADAVLDSRMRVRGVEGLRICDLSAMPNISAGNTAAPAMMLGSRCAELIRGTRPMA